MHITASTTSLALIAGTALTLTTPHVVASDATSRELLGDAVFRTSHQGGGTYGAQGFSISDASGDNTLSIGGTLQFTYTLGFRDDAAVGETADVTNGFRGLITRLRASGTVGTKDLSYRIRHNFNGGDGVAELEEAYAAYNLGNGWTITWGQFTLPTVRENIVDAEGTLGPGFSVISEFFNQGYSQGLMATYEQERFRAFAAFSDGLGSSNSTFDESVEADYAITLRLEGILLGDTFSRFNDYTSFRSTSGDHVLLGGAVHWQDGGETNGTNNWERWNATIDLSWEGPGYNLTIAGVAGMLDFNNNLNKPEDFGLNVQGGYFFSDSVEGFARVDTLFYDAEGAGNPTADDTHMFVTLGANYYPFVDSSAVKFSAQGTYSVNNSSASYLGGESNGLMGQNDDGELVFMLAAQVVF